MRKPSKGAYCFAVVTAALLALPTAVEAARLEIADVTQVLTQVAREAQARSAPATIAVVDRSGNVLGVMRMPGANGGGGTVKIFDNPRGPNTGVAGAIVPDVAAAIAKAITGAYLSSNSGNGFTTRTASEIVQDHFLPAERFQPSGPLYGVQFSQLPCSDISRRTASGAMVGPKRSPLGLAADPGGFPLYKAGELVGGVGAIADGLYGLDPDPRIINADVDELIALAGTVGYDTPIGIRADRITAGGKFLRYSNSGADALLSSAASGPSLAQFLAAGSALVPVTGYFAGSLIAGTEFNTAASGVRADTSGVYGSLPAHILVNAANQNRYPPRDSTAITGGLTAGEVAAILRNGLAVALRSRAQIRQPFDSFVQVSLTVVDVDGTVLGLTRTPDGPVFGIDVSAQKARTAALFSRPEAAGILRLTPGGLRYVQQSQEFLGGGAFANGLAFTARAIGNLARPYYPDGIDGRPNGPLSNTFAESTPVSTGLQTDIIAGPIVQHLTMIANGGATADVGQSCAPANVPGGTLLSNGIQIFPGAVPIYRNGTLVGGFGISGDGVDQDDMVAFLGLANAGREAGTGIGNAPPAIRSDNLVPRSARLRYVSCPFAPFLGSSEQTPCRGL